MDEAESMTVKFSRSPIALGEDVPDVLLVSPVAMKILV